MKTSSPGSLRGKILLVTILVVTVIQALFGFIEYKTDKAKEYENLDRAISSTEENILHIIRDSVYNFDEVAVRQIVDAHLKGDASSLVALLVYQQEEGEERLFAGRVVAPDGSISDADRAPPGKFYRVNDRDIVKHGSKAGHVVFYFTDAKAAKAVREALGRIVIAFLALMTVLVAAIYTAMNHVVTRPILSTARMVNEAAEAMDKQDRESGAMEAILDFEATEDELGSLNKAMEKLFHARAKELARSEEWYRALIENINEMVFVIDPGNQIKYVSPAAARILGYKPSGIHMSGLETLHPEDAMTFESMIKKAVHEPGEPQSQKLRFRHETGDYLTFASTATSYLGNPSIQGIVVNFHDITSIAAASEALSESESRFKQLVESGFEGIVIHEKGIIIDSNTQMANMLGYAQKEIQSRSIFDFMPEESRQAAIKAMGKMDELAGREVNIDALELVRKDGTRVIVETRAHGIQYMGKEMRVVCVRDITGRKAIETRLQEYKERYDYATSVGKVGIWDWYPVTGRLVWNEEVYKLLGLAEPYGEATYEMFMEKVSPEDRGRFNAAVMDSLNNRTPFVTEYKVVRSDGQLRMFLAIGKVTYNDEGRPIRMMGTFQDITKRKEVEKALRDAKEDAENATKLKDNFVSLVSHDLRSPLGGISSMLTLLKNKKSYNLDEEKESQIVRRAIDSAQGLLNLIDKLLDLSRLKTGKITVKKHFFSAYQSAELRLGNLSYNAEEKKITLRNEIPRTMRIFADESLFGEVLHNLVTNAIKFTNQGGVITVYAPDDRPTTIAVRDTGVGISPEALASIFSGESHSTTKGTAGEKGTGLGLQYCREIMAAHGGSLTAESEPDKGSVFHAKLPDVKAVVLLVDDTQAQREIMKDMLANYEGTDIMEAENGLEALEIMRKSLPHLVVTDLSMPVMDGFRLIDEIRRNPLFRELPVIAVTSMSSSGGDDKEMDVRKRVFELGANDFVTKPFTRREFTPRVYRFLGHA